MSVNTKMTAIADKIRALLGLTGTMGLDAMATNLGTEQANVTAALTAIADKGVTVPDGSTSGALAGLIAAIQTGGGESGGSGDIAYGVFEPGGWAGMRIDHGLGSVPNTVIFCFVGLLETFAEESSSGGVITFIPNRNDHSCIWYMNNEYYYSKYLSADEAGNMFGTGTESEYNDRISNINEQYFYTPDTLSYWGPYFWLVSKNALL